jgi:hypothetical protein
LIHNALLVTLCLKSSTLGFRLPYQLSHQSKGVATYSLQHSSLHRRLKPLALFRFWVTPPPAQNPIPYLPNFPPRESHFRLGFGNAFAFLSRSNYNSPYPTRHHITGESSKPRAIVSRQGPPTTYHNLTMNIAPSKFHHMTTTKSI